MLRQNLINIITFIPIALITGLVLAWPVRQFLGRILGAKTGYWKAYLLTCLIDLTGHITRIIILTLLGGFAPAISNLWGSWVGNGLLLVVMGALIIKRFMAQSVSDSSYGRLFMACGIMAGLFLMRDAVLFIIVSQALPAM